MADNRGRFGERPPEGSFEERSGAEHYRYQIRHTPLPERWDPYIPTPLLERAQRLENLEYSHVLQPFAKQYLDARRNLEAQKAVRPKLTDEALEPYRARCLEVLSDAFGDLLEWACEQSGLPYETLMKQIACFASIERSLYESSDDYRDHLVHPVSVLLLGSVVLDEHLPYLAHPFNDMAELESASAAPVQVAWVLASALHDVACGIERFGDLLRYHIGEVVCLQPAGHLQFEDLLGPTPAESMRAQLARIAAFFKYSCGTARSKGRGWDANGQSLRSHLGQALLDLYRCSCDPTCGPTHGVCGAVAFMNASAGRATSMPFVLPVATALATHHLSREQLVKATGGRGMTLSRHPTALLLRYCDLAAEFHRAPKLRAKGGWGAGMLEDINVGPDVIGVSVHVPGRMLDKSREVCGVADMLVADISPNVYVNFISQEDSNRLEPASFPRSARL